MRTSDRRAGIATGDALLVLASLALAFALAYPRMERLATRNTAAEAAATVETVRAAAEDFRRTRGSWPPASPLGEIPQELVPHLPPDFSFRGPGYSLKWDSWVRVELPDTVPPEAPELPPGAATSPPPPPPPPDSVSAPAVAPRVLPLGAITVVPEDSRILAALLEAFGMDHSFIRDDAWTLVFGEPPPTP